jgi:outer membrane protein TolC
VDRLRREIGTEVVEAHAEALAGVARWRAAEGAAEASRGSVRLTQRAYALGEADLQALLLARRQSLEAARAALESRVEALRWRHRLLVDAHLVWDLEND